MASIQELSRDHVRKSTSSITLLRKSLSSFPSTSTSLYIYIYISTYIIDLTQNTEPSIYQADSYYHHLQRHLFFTKFHMAVKRKHKFRTCWPTL